MGDVSRRCVRRHALRRPTPRGECAPDARRRRRNRPVLGDVRPTPDGRGPQDPGAVPHRDAGEGVGARGGRVGCDASQAPPGHPTNPSLSPLFCPGPGRAPARRRGRPVRLRPAPSPCAHHAHSQAVQRGNPAPAADVGRDAGRCLLRAQPLARARGGRGVVEGGAGEGGRVERAWMRGRARVRRRDARWCASAAGRVGGRTRGRVGVRSRACPPGHPRLATPAPQHALANNAHPPATSRSCASRA